MNTRIIGLAVLATLGIGGQLLAQRANQPEPERPPAVVHLAKPPPAASLLFKKKLNTGPTSLKGFVDLHTHPMSHLAMGGKLLHGAPDEGILMPAGAIWNPTGVGLEGSTCNEKARDAASVEEALGSCYSTHAGHDFHKNKCGNHIRRMVLNAFEDGKHTNKPHNVDHPPGYPTFTKWPKHDDILHQQMWIDWIKRAHAGGMRVMVALTVNSMTFAKGLEANQPYDDKSIGDMQVAQMKRLVAKHQAWMEIAYSPADLRRIVGQDKLAVILGSELDDIGAFAWSKREPTRGQVTAEIDRLYRSGIRYIFPVHVIDNYFGGTAIYEAEFPRASKYHFGHWPSIECAAKEDGITATLSNGWDVFKTMSLGDAGGSFPIPSCKAGVGFKNKRRLQELGKLAIDQMMERGMIIDIDHASQRTADDIVAHAASKPGVYPLVSGHNGLRGDSATDPHVHENTRTAAQYQAIAAGKGVAGIGFGELTSEQFIQEVRRALKAAPGLPINLGSDINGFVVMPGPENCGGASGVPCVAYSDDFPKAKMGKKEWDYNTEGVAHIGLFPDFLRKVELRGAKDVVDKLFEGAEAVAVMWERAETVGKAVKAAAPTTFDSITAVIRTRDDDVRNGARAWVSIQLKSGNLPEVEISHLAKGANVVKQLEIPVKSAIKANDVVGVKVRHFSNDCFACARDYWNGQVELESEHGDPILKTPEFRIGHETKTFKAP